MRTEQVLHMDLWGISTNSKYNFMQGEKIMFFTLTKQICLWSTAFPHWQVVWDPNGRELFITWGGGDIVCCAKFCQEVLHLYTGGQTGGGGEAQVPVTVCVPRNVFLALSYKSGSHMHPTDTE